MRALLIFVVASAFVIFECQSLKCYKCVGAPNCLKSKPGRTDVVTCNTGEVCQRTFRRADDPDNKPQPGDDFGIIGGAVQERLCNKKTVCDKRKEKMQLFLTTCCTTDLCNK